MKFVNSPLLLNHQITLFRRQYNLTKMSRQLSHSERRAQAWKQKQSKLKREEFQEDLAMAKVNRKLKKELRKDMEIIRQGKGKRRHKNRSKRRDSSSDATFSTDSDRESRRTPIKQTKISKPEVTKLSTEQLYDIVTKSPERPTPLPTAFHPNGSVLTLTTSKIEITTRSSLLTLQAQILTQQSHHSLLLQLFNPGMSHLLINKDKNQTQIIDHLIHTTKKYRFLLCWLEPTTQEGRTEMEKVISEVNSQGRILGWFNQDVKMHFLTLRQLRMVEKIVIPSGLLGFGEKLVMIIQYPQTYINIRHKYQPFSNVSIKEPLNTIIHTKPDYSSINIVYEGWDQAVKQEPQTTEQVPSLPEHIQKIKEHFGIREFQPILSDEEDHKEPVRDLASELLDAIKAIPSPAEQYPKQLHNNYYNMMYQVPMKTYNPFNPINGKFTFAFKYNHNQNNSHRKGHEHLNASYSLNPPYQGYQP